MRKLRIIALIVVLLQCCSAFAQRSELGVMAGTSFYMGDINTDKLFAQSRFSAGLIYRYNFSTRWALKMNALYAQVKGDDAKYDNPRNLSFRSNIYDFSAQAEFNFLNYFTGSEKYSRFTPYLFGGMALFFFNPEAYVVDNAHPEGNWVALQPLSTEGQGLSAYPDTKTYSLAQFAIPFGLGFKFSLSKKICIGAEWSMRKTFTDYLDDISTVYVDPNVLRSEVGDLSAELSDRSVDPNPVGSARGNSKNKDWYSVAGVFMTVKIGAPRQEPCNAYKRSSISKARNQGDL